MQNLHDHNKEYFDVFLEERKIPDPDELLGKALRYLRSQGKHITILGFDSKGTPVINIDDTLYTFDKYFGIWERARFTKTADTTCTESCDSRIVKIESYSK